MAESLYAVVWDALIAAFDAGGMVTAFGRGPPGLFERVGLDAVEGSCQTPVFRGGTAYAGVSTARIAQLLPLLLGAGVSEAEREELGRLIHDPTKWFPHFATYSVRGPVPGTRS